MHIICGVAGERLTGPCGTEEVLPTEENACLIKRAREKSPEALKAQSETETIPAPLDENEETRNARHEKAGKRLKRSVRA